MWLCSAVGVGVFIYRYELVFILEEMLALWLHVFR